VVVSGGPTVDLAALEEAAGPQGAAVAPSDKIGLLGRAVAPLLYVAVEVEDEPEHWAGSVKAGVIVSIGASSPAAADVSVEGDWRSVLPTLLDVATRNR
jgi:electron transfer flavoprotein alpha subunit